ncbi:MAG: hypothetical protein WCR07_11795 [Verrucomicrobiota bacterium]
MKAHFSAEKPLSPDGNALSPGEKRLPTPDSVFRRLMSGFPDLETLFPGQKGTF